MARKDAYLAVKADPENYKEAFISSPEMLKKLILEQHIPAQQVALECLPELINSFGPSDVPKITKMATVAIVEKPLLSAKESIRQNATECLLLLIQYDRPEAVLSELIPLLKSKMAKQSTAVVGAINEIYNSYGCTICDYQNVVEYIPKLYNNPDRKVKAETIKLFVTIRSEIGESFQKLVFNDLKPSQQKDMANAFAKFQSNPTEAKPKRQQIRQKQPNGSNNLDIDVDMPDANISVKVVDPWETATPVDITNLLPIDLNQRLAEPKWDDRLRILNEILPKIDNVLRIKDVPALQDFLKKMTKCLTDVNSQVVITASSIINAIANGLKDDFAKYIPEVLSALLDRTKDKKRQIVDAIAASSDVCFRNSSWNAILPVTFTYMHNKIPQVKIETLQFLLRCLRVTNQPPSSQEVNSIMNETISLLGDAQLPVRDTSMEIIGTLMKIIGEAKSKKFMEKIDKRHQKRVHQYAQAAVISIGSIPEAPHPVRQTTNGLKSIMPMPVMENPLKRGATSPLKTSNLTTKSLKVNGVRSISGGKPAPPVKAQILSENTGFEEERNALFEEKRQLLAQLQSQQQAYDDSSKQCMQLSARLNDFEQKFNQMNVMLRNKETTLVRLQADLNASRIREQQLEQKLKIHEQQQPMHNESAINASFERNEIINNKISNLTINEPTKLTSIYDFQDTDDSWKRATAVTNDLKAKIQRMKARTRNVSGNML